MYFVYILKSLVQPDETYIGYTERTPEQRLQDHNAGFSAHTNQFKPWKIIWFCAFEDRIVAMRFEHYLKTASGIAFRNKRLIEQTRNSHRTRKNYLGPLAARFQGGKRHFVIKWNH